MRMNILTIFFFFFAMFDSSVFVQLHLVQEKMNILKMNVPIDAENIVTTVTVLMLIML